MDELDLVGSCLSSCDLTSKIDQKAKCRCLSQESQNENMVKCSLTFFKFVPDGSIQLQRHSHKLLMLLNHSRNRCVI